MTISRADIIWRSATPFSNQYNDAYFNTIDGLNESLHVFLEPNNVDRGSSIFDKTLIIAETGFGSGLNFFQTIKTRAHSHTKMTWLHYIAAEKHPISSSDFQKILSKLKKNLTNQSLVINQYPETPYGFHRLIFPDISTSLTLLFGDATECYSQLLANVDIWYLDGFSPSKNPEMWSPELFREIARLSKPGTTFSTFTSASKVRKGLEAVGFEVRKQPGFGKKREMSLGTFTKDKTPIESDKPWFGIPETDTPEAVTIIGGGLAGCSTAHSLAQRGVKVTIIEKAQRLASGGSGNRQGALYAKLPISPTKQGELHLSGFLYSVNFLKQLDPQQTLWSQCGVAQLATSDKERSRQQQMLDNGHYPSTLVQHKTALELSDIADSTIKHDGLFFPDAGWVSPIDLCNTLTSHPNIEVIQAQVSDLNFSNGCWALTSNDGDMHHCSHIVLCNAELANQFQETAHLPLKAIRGQVSITPPSASTSPLNTVICGDGYISPALNKRFCFGATFDLKGQNLDITATDHQKNLDKLAHALPSIHKELMEKEITLEGRAAFRCSTPDYMPVVGAAPVYEHFIDNYSKLRQDKNWRFDDAKAKHHPNLFINTGHGSKGLITCPISAELLASMLCNEPLPLPKDLIDAINPSRFIIKNLIKQAI